MTLTSVANTIIYTAGVHAFNLDVVPATTLQRGAIVLATDALTIAGVVADEAVAPSSLKAKLGTQTLHGLPIGAGSNAAIAWTAEPSNGQLLIGKTGNPPVLATLTQGVGIAITNGAGTITIDAVGGGITWNSIPGNTVALVADNGYMLNNAGLTTATLPVTCAEGKVIKISGSGTGLFTIAQNAGQSIKLGNVSSTGGVMGSLTSTDQYDAIELLCIVADTVFATLGSVGNFSLL